MNKKMKFRVEFVDFIPSLIVDCTLFISMKYKIAVHNCPCGCGNKVFTPICKNDGWTMHYDGETISLFPSIGNYKLDCKSHYFYKNNEIIWVTYQDRLKQKGESKFSFKYKKNKKRKH